MALALFPPLEVVAILVEKLLIGLLLKFELKHFLFYHHIVKKVVIVVVL